VSDVSGREGICNLRKIHHRLGKQSPGLGMGLGRIHRVVESKGR